MHLSRELFRQRKSSKVFVYGSVFLPIWVNKVLTDERYPCTIVITWLDAANHIYEGGSMERGRVQLNIRSSVLRAE